MSGKPGIKARLAALVKAHRQGLHGRARDAARACSGLCASELEVFQAALGPDYTVTRTDHILTGARRCAYLVREDG